MLVSPIKIGPLLKVCVGFTVLDVNNRVWSKTDVVVVYVYSLLFQLMFYLWWQRIVVPKMFGSLRIAA
jgi:hypothetical protein